MFTFGDRSRSILENVQLELRILAERVIKISPIDFAITSGLRTRDEQQKLYESGKSKTLNSKHLSGKALDFVPWHSGTAYFYDLGSCSLIAGLFIALAEESLQLKIRTGVLWDGNLVSANEFLDAYHIEI
ncbi:MAG: hypothetical protein LBB13_00440 [Rickettsiales bacterium]|jgi:hypothetical protein|nr:hypothetical protein [Rickettsiales bacterium]